MKIEYFSGDIGVYIRKAGIPIDDVSKLSEQKLWSAALPLFLYVTANAITMFHSIIISTAVNVFSYILGIFFGR